MDHPALALLEFRSIAAGIAAGDAMVKRAPVAAIQSGTVQPGHYLVMIVGDVASVGEAVSAGKAAGDSELRDTLFLPQIHPLVVAAIGGQQQAGAADALGIIETHTVAAAIHAADAGVKGTEARLLQVRLADGLGGKGLVLFQGVIADVETAVGIGVAAAAGQIRQQQVIPQLHAEMWPNINAHGRFGTHFNWEIS